MVQVSGGSSTEFQASGAAAQIHFPNSTLSASAGYADGRFVFGGSDTFGWRGWDITAGDQSLAFTAGGAGLGLSARGIGFTRRWSHQCGGALPAAAPPLWGVGAPGCSGGTSELTFFAGATGRAYYAPFLYAGQADHAGAGFFYRRKWRALESATLGAIAGRQYTAIESVSWRYRAVQLQGTGGVLQSARYLGGQVDIRPAQWLAFSGARTAYSFATVSSAGAYVAAGPLNFHGAVFNSGHTTGEAIGAGARLGFVDARVDSFKTRASMTTTGSLTERIGRRWHVAEFVSESGGRYSLSFGGGYASNRLSVDVSQQTYFMPLLGRFQQAAAVTLSIHLPHDSAATISTTLDPLGRVRYSAYGGTWLEGHGPGGSPASRVSFKSGLIIRGRVSDSAGSPVSGAAISVCGQIVYSNDAGEWQARLRRPQPCDVFVDIGESAMPGHWSAQTAPQRVIPTPETGGTSVELKVVPLYP